MVSEEMLLRAIDNIIISQFSRLKDKLGVPISKSAICFQHIDTKIGFCLMSFRCVMSERLEENT
jgi:hypothetical protein